MARGVPNYPPQSRESISFGTGSTYTLNEDETKLTIIIGKENDLVNLKNQENLSLQKIKSATISTTGDGQLTSEDINCMHGGWNMEKSIFPNIEELDLRNSAVSTGWNESMHGFNNEGSKLVKVTLPKDVSPEGALKDNKIIKEVIIPSASEGKTTVIKTKECFANMSSLETVTIGSGIVTTADAKDVFAQCNNLQTVIFLPGTTDIPPGMFQKCASLKNIVIPEGVRTIGEYAFEGAKELTAIHLPNSLERICEGAFHSCSNLEMLVIPQNVKEIQTNSFSGCTNLTDVFLEGTDVMCGQNAFSPEMTYNNAVFKGKDKRNAALSDWDDAGNKTLRLHFPVGYKNKYVNFFILFINDNEALSTLKDKTYDEASEIIFKVTVDKDNDDEEDKVYEHKLGDFIEGGILGELLKYINGETEELPWAEYHYTINGEDRVTRLPLKGYGGSFESGLVPFEYAVDENGDRIKDENGNDIKQYGPNIGWRQFVLTVNNFSELTYNEERIVEDRWYSMCFPFNMTETQIVTAFGPLTDIRTFEGTEKQVITNTETGYEETYLTFNFNGNPQEETKRLLGEDTRYVTMANRPYMIHPGSGTRQASGPVARVIPNVSEEDASTDGKLPVATDCDDNYIFVGNYAEGVKLPAGAYYFGYNADGELLFNHITKESKYDWTPFIAIIKSDDRTTNNAKIRFAFDKPEDDSTTGIDNVEQFDTYGDTACKIRGIYSVSGQMISCDTGSAKSLPSGFYIINGKKVVIK